LVFWIYREKFGGAGPNAGAAPFLFWGGLGVGRCKGLPSFGRAVRV
jgi:hypothetical protein